MLWLARTLTLIAVVMLVVPASLRGHCCASLLAADTASSEAMPCHGQIDAGSRHGDVDAKGTSLSQDCTHGCDCKMPALALRITLLPAQAIPAQRDTFLPHILAPAILAPPNRPPIVFS